MNKKAYEVFERIISTGLNSVREIAGFQRSLRLAIQSRWKKPKIDPGEKLNVIMAEDLRPGGKEARLAREAAEKKDEKKHLYISKRDAY